MRALLSVYDKTGIADFARDLVALGYELISTGGTFTAIAEAGLPVTQVADVTGSPEILDGRVKTLHPRIHGGLLARRDLDDHMAQLVEHEIVPIDIVASNLYPFERVVSSPGVSDEDIIENIDIGGPAMVRASAKNFASVLIVTNPGDYDAVVAALREGTTDTAFRRKLAAKAYAHVSAYDALISQYLREQDGTMFPDELSIPLRLVSTPKYGENPQQEAAAYRRLRPGTPEHGLLDAELLVGDALSFNNYLDTDAAWQAAQLLDGAGVAIVKHMVPCGLATRESLVEAYVAAYEGDTVSAYGGIVALNQPVDGATAAQMRKIKLDIIIAPDYDEDAIASLAKKKGTRILRLANRDAATPRSTTLDVRPIGGGLLVQTPDNAQDDPAAWTIVTERKPTADELRDMAFAWQAARLVKSNAIVFAKDDAVIGLGAGQPNRLESVAIAARKAGERAQGAAMASDAFFPFADGIEQAIAAGITAVVQPGGSIRDDDVIAAANAAGITMAFTGIRHFRH
ncbi:MAG: bifunctional phosphoribosylaminoimidazolecarboxamide formyltransferase/IMP cyclohydrolase [Thermomicrobiales bacterium]